MKRNLILVVALLIILSLGIFLSLRPQIDQQEKNNTNPNPDSTAIPVIDSSKGETDNAITLEIQNKIIVDTLDFSIKNSRNIDISINGSIDLFNKEVTEGPNQVPVIAINCLCADGKCSDEYLNIKANETKQFSVKLEDKCIASNPLPAEFISGEYYLNLTFYDKVDNQVRALKDTFTIK